MVQQLAKNLITEAVESRVTDLYFLPLGGDYSVTARKKDSRIPLMTLNQEDYQALLAHFKFLAGMNVGERRRTQVGACSYDYGPGTISLRFSTVGDFRNRETLVIRLLYDRLEELHFWYEDMAKLAKQYSKRGLYLFAGPVGSGKTSLMYRLAQESFKGSQILSIEDPVEIQSDQILQLQVNPEIGLTYDNLIKLSLRHRPDLLMIGEIRDSQTAHAVIRASLTGVTVFSTIHAKGVKGVYDRMLELGVSKYELDRSLQGVCYQRLIKGGGLIDFAKEKFKYHSSRQWNQQVLLLHQEGIITDEEARKEQIEDAATAEDYSTIS